jgi:hypothetical protein
LGMPEADRFESVSPALAGSRFRGARVTAREVFWPLHVLAADGEAWLALDSAFWATMRPDLPGSWAVTVGGVTRNLVCRWVSGGDDYIMDPVLAGWASYGVYLVADDDPYWTGAPIVRSWSPGTAVDFVDAGGSPPFHISPGNLLAQATMDNPGNVEAFPVWRIDGPTTTVEVGVDGRVVEVPFAVADGDSVIVDTRPTAQTAVMSDGTDVTADLGEVDFAPIQPGAVVPLSLSMTGTGTVTATLTPRYMKAFG